MGNTSDNGIDLDTLTPELFRRADKVSREMVGMIPAVTNDMSAAIAAKDQVVRSFKTEASASAPITEGQLPPDTGDQNFNTVDLVITKSEGVPIRWGAEEMVRLSQGVTAEAVFADQVEQAMRNLTNQVEADLANLYTKASRAYSPAGSTLFDANNYKDLANVRKGLNINGAPIMDRQLVMSNCASAAFVGNAQNTDVDTSGEDNILKQGLLSRRFGFDLRESAQIVDHTAGDAAGATTDAAGYAIGDTELTLAAAGTGAILAGDVIQITGDDNEYVVVSGDADVSDAGTITIAAPGLKQAIPAAATAISVIDKPERNMAFSRNAIHLVTRAPAMPPGGDMARSIRQITDDRSGLSFQLVEYAERRRIHYEVALAWGVQMIKPEHCVLLLDA